MDFLRRRRRRRRRGCCQRDHEISGRDGGKIDLWAVQTIQWLVWVRKVLAVLKRNVRYQMSFL